MVVFLVVVTLFVVLVVFGNTTTRGSSSSLVNISGAGVTRGALRGVATARVVKTTTKKAEKCILITRCLDDK